jgi:hypothetical protein
VFIVGESGTGKSTFIINEFGDYFLAQFHQPVTLFISMEKLLAWATSTDLGLKVLFLDEANLEQNGAYDLFEGLYNDPPGIFISGTFYPLSSEHKIIACGNFSHYPGRHQHRFFANHGAVTLYKELPNSFLDKYILDPLLRKSGLLSEENIKYAKTFFLNIYRYINSREDLRFKLTPRNLEMMCLRLWVFAKECLESPYEHALSQVNTRTAVNMELSAYELSDEVRYDLLHQFNIHDEYIFNEPFESKAFTLTKSRELCFELMSEMLATRALKIEHDELTGRGVKGILIEGESGNGKSAAVEEYLKWKGFVNGFEHEHDGTPNHLKFYPVTPTNLADMIAICLRAARERSILVIHELNTLPLAPILNQLMMGLDLQGKKLASDLYVFATQNPISFKGRLVASRAEENRFQKIIYPALPKKEMEAIATEMGLDVLQVEQYADMYFIASQYADMHHKEPRPNPRNFFTFIRQKVQEAKDCPPEPSTKKLKL